jgi:hypothetical protein
MRPALLIAALDPALWPLVRLVFFWPLVALLVGFVLGRVTAPRGHK